MTSSKKSSPPVYDPNQGRMLTDEKEKLALQQRLERRKNRGSAEPADWHVADAGLLREAIECVTRRGGAIQFGYTRDVGAFAIRMVGFGDPTTEYVRPTEDIDLFLRGIIEDFGG